MTTLSKSVSKSQKRSLCNVSFAVLQYQNRLHFSSQYIAFNAECDGSVSEIPAYTGTH